MDDISTHVINQIEEMNELMAEFPDVFEEKIGCILNYTMSLKLREKVTPVFHREREIPYALCDRIEKELNARKEWNYYKNRN